MIEVLDNYKLFKNPDGTHAIDVEIKNHKQSFKANDVYDLMNLLGDWLCKLPKSTWAEFNNKKVEMKRIIINLTTFRGMCIEAIHYYVTVSYYDSCNDFRSDKIKRPINSKRNKF